MIGDLLTPSHAIILVVIALLVFGPRRLPEIGRGLGKGLRDFRSAMRGEPEEGAEDKGLTATVPVAEGEAGSANALPKSLDKIQG